MAEFEFEIPQEIQNMIAQCDDGCSIKTEIKPKKRNSTEIFSEISGNASALMLTIVVLMAQVCLGIGAEDNSDPLMTWAVVAASAKQMIIDNTEEEKEA